MFPTSAVISAGMHNIKSPPASPPHSIPTRRSMKDLLGLSRVQAPSHSRAKSHSQAPSRPLTAPRPEPVTPKAPVSQHEASHVHEIPDSQRTVIQRRSTLRSAALISPTAHRGSVHHLQLARAIQVNNPGDNFSYMSSLSSTDSTSTHSAPPTLRVASSVYSRTASGYFPSSSLDNELALALALAADAAAARTFLQQQQNANANANANAPGAISPRTSHVPSYREGYREGEGRLSPFPSTDPLESPLPYGTRGWASTGPHAAPSVAARRASEEASAAAAAAATAAVRKRTGVKKVVDKILGRK